MDIGLEYPSGLVMSMERRCSPSSRVFRLLGKTLAIAEFPDLKQKEGYVYTRFRFIFLEALKKSSPAYIYNSQNLVFSPFKPPVRLPAPMPSLENRHILLGEGIAAYKAAELSRGGWWRPALKYRSMTDAAKAFISPLTMQAVSGRPVRDTLLDPAAEAGMGHIELGRWADLVLVAPASADFLGIVIRIFRFTCGRSNCKSKRNKSL